VYDIGEIDGHHFLSMEYIDGEDLKVLLRRIGRLPKDKGVQIAQQLCSGLAAAHDRSVLHRDLKPANIMIDGHGQVRITDFGLAKLAEEGAEREVAGTPAYMAPEQLTRGEATIQSDLYALGLILYELFTGKAVHQSSSLPELIKAHEESSPSQPSSLVEDMDPAVDRVILRCLAKKPQERPKSARAVAAALPGGDPLAAALAAGETPSPEMVAAAGETGTLPLRTGIFCLAAVLVGLIGVMLLSPLMQPTAAPDSLNPGALRRDVQKILLDLKYYDDKVKPKDIVHGLQLRKRDGDQHWEFWYRQRSTGYLTPTIKEITQGPKTYAMSMFNPSPNGDGMVSVRTDFAGKVIELLAVPEGPSSINVIDSFETALASAGLSSDHVREVARFGRIMPPSDTHSPDTHEQTKGSSATLPENWRPPIYSDRTAIYRPTSDTSSEWVIAAHDQGRLVYFYAGPVKQGRFADRQFDSPDSSGDKGNRSYHQLLQLIVLLPAIFLAMRNVRLGRADRKGALRFAIWLGGMQILIWLFGLHHVAHPMREWVLLRDFLREPWLAYFFRHWLYYMALEPYIRRYWPDVLIAWSRAVDGRFRDPLLGQRLLIGSLIGLLTWLICCALYASPAGLPGHGEPFVIRFDVNSPLRPVATVLFVLSLCASNAVFALMLLFLLRSLLRDTRLAVAAYVLLNVAVFGLDGKPVMVLLIIAVWSAGLGLAITRFGLMSGITFIFAQALLEIFPITAHVTSWYGSGTLVAWVSILAVSGYGFYTSTLAFRVRQSAEVAQTAGLNG
jgi:serine/threonine-protein kinase